MKRVWASVPLKVCRLFPFQITYWFQRHYVY